MGLPFNQAAARLFSDRPGLRSFEWLDANSPVADPPGEADAVRAFLAGTTFGGRRNYAAWIRVGRPAGNGPCPVTTELVRS